MSDFGEIKQLLKQNLEVSRESLRILKKLHKAKKIALVFKALYWLFILAMVFGVYYYVQPIFGSFLESFERFQTDISSLRSIPFSK